MKKINLIFIVIIFLFLISSLLITPSALAQTCQGVTSQTTDYQACDCQTTTGNYCDGVKDFTSNDRFLCNWADPQKTICGACIKDQPYQLCLNTPDFSGNQCGGLCKEYTPNSDGTCSSLGLPSGYSWYSAGGAGAGQNCSVTYPTCSQNTVCGACIPATGPTNTCGYVACSQTCQQNQPQPCNTNTWTNNTSTPYNSCNAGAGYTCPNPNGNQVPCVTNINVHVYVDYNHDGTKNGNDTAYNYQNSDNYKSGGNNYYAVISDGGGNNFNANTGGTVTFSGKTTGNYTISMSTVPTGYKIVGNISQNISLTNTNGNVTVNFFITPLYTISGTIFNDVNLNGSYESATESAFTQASTTVHVSGGPTSVSDMTQSTGVYNTGQVLESGVYTVALTSALPSGYRATTPTSWQVTVGDTGGSTYLCSVGGSQDATCVPPNNGSISGLDFGLSNEKSWIQPVCGDARVDSGYSQQIPSTANCGGTAAPYAITSNTLCQNNVPGILFSGNVDPVYGTGLGASTANVVVGGSLFPELFNFHLPNTSDASYSFINTSANNLTAAPVALTTICPDLTKCTLSENTPGGIYTTTAADGPVSISVVNGDGTFNLGPTNYTFLIAGNLTFTSNVLVQTGYSATFTSGGNIDVASNVGESNWNSISPDLEGFFSANGNFTLDSAGSAGNVCQANGQPLDKKLNIVGSVIANAGNAGGSFINNREGCVQDLSCPTATFSLDPIQILHTPGVLKPGNTFWQELNP